MMGGAGKVLAGCGKEGTGVCMSVSRNSGFMDIHMRSDSCRWES